jgi:hypothetical protein
MVRFLLANGADAETQLFLKHYVYVTPLIFAIEMENREIVQVPSSPKCPLLREVSVCRRRRTRVH